MRLAKIIILSLTITSFLSCGNAEYTNRIEDLEKEVEKLEESMPGLGWTMNLIQIYHTKFYFAMKEGNTEVMTYVHHELEENFESVVENHGDHDGIDIAGVAKNTVLPALEELKKSIDSKNDSLILQSFEFLTVTCNKCHYASEHPFIKIKYPEGESYLNQDFTIAD